MATELVPSGPPEGSPPGSAGRSSYRRLLANGDYLRVFSAGLASVAGSAIAVVSLTWIVAEATGSFLDVGLLGAAWMLSSIAFSAFAGALVDRSEPRRLMVLSDLVRAAAMGGAAADLLLQGFRLPILLGAYAVVGAFTSLFSPAENAAIPRLVPTEQTADANGLVSSTRSALRFVGSGAGGALILAVGPVAGILANAATFLLSAALLAGVRPVPVARPADRGARPAYLREIGQGFRWLVQARGFLELTLSATLFNFCSTLVGAFLVFYATLVLHGSAGTFALLLAVEVAGSGLGSLLVGPMRAVRFAGLAWTVPYGVLSGAAALALALLPSVPTALLALFALGVFGGFAGTAWLTAAQTLVPREMQGRYFGIDNLGSVAIVPAAQLGGAVLLGAFGILPTYLAVAAVWAVGGLLFLLPRSLRRLGAPAGPERARYPP